MDSIDSYFMGVLAINFVILVFVFAFEVCSLLLTILLPGSLLPGMTLLNHVVCGLHSFLIPDKVPRIMSLSDL